LNAAKPNFRVSRVVCSWYSWSIRFSPLHPPAALRLALKPVVSQTLRMASTRRRRHVSDGGSTPIGVADRVIFVDGATRICFAIHRWEILFADALVAGEKLNGRGFERSAWGAVRRGGNWTQENPAGLGNHRWPGGTARLGGRSVYGRDETGAVLRGEAVGRRPWRRAGKE